MKDLTELILSKFSARRPEVLYGALIGEDTSAVKLTDACVISTDPITAADSDAGFLAMYVNANDVAASGAAPFAAVVTMLFPPSVTEEEIKRTADQIAEAAEELGTEIIGGHTEITDAVRRCVLSVTILGLPVVPGHIVRTCDMRADDTIVMSKYAGIEGTMILAGKYAAELAGRLDESDERQLELLRGFISVVPEGKAGAEDPLVSAMHDITEGGVIGAVQEMCAASGLGAVIDRGKIPLLPVTRKICSILKIDPERLISSGSMLFAVSDQSRLMEELAELGIPATVIGHADPEPGVRDKETGELLAVRTSDELYSAPHAGGDSR